LTLTWRGAGGLSVEQHREADSRFKLDRKAQTERLLRAMSKPHTTIIGHMTGRQLQRRPATCNP
jgi:histidinol phosphatase-like PHP family hydrolase